MFLFFWFLAGLIGAGIFAYEFLWKYEENVVEVTGAALLLFTLVTLTGLVGLVAGLILLIGDFLDSETFDGLLEKKLFSFEKKKK